MTRSRAAVICASAIAAAVLAIPAPAGANHSDAGDAWADCRLWYPNADILIRTPGGLDAVGTTGGVDWQTIRFNVELWYADAEEFRWRLWDTSANFVTPVNDGGWVKGKKRRRGKKRKRRWVAPTETTAYWVHEPSGRYKRWAAKWDTKFDVATEAIANITWIQNGRTVHSERWRLRALNYQQPGGNRAWGYQCYQPNPFSDGRGTPGDYTSVYWD